MSFRHPDYDVSLIEWKEEILEGHEPQATVYAQSMNATVLQSVTGARQEVERMTNQTYEVGKTYEFIGGPTGKYRATLTANGWGASEPVQAAVAPPPPPAAAQSVMAPPPAPAAVGTVVQAPAKPARDANVLDARILTVNGLPPDFIVGKSRCKWESEPAKGRTQRKAVFDNLGVIQGTPEYFERKGACKNSMSLTIEHPDGLTERQMDERELDGLYAFGHVMNARIAELRGKLGK